MCTQIFLHCSSQQKTKKMEEEPREEAPLVPNLPTCSTKLTMGSHACETRDFQDHFFCGIMFDLEARSNSIPFLFTEVQQIAVRGNLGNMTIFASPGGYRGKQNRPNEWEIVSGPKNVEPSPHELVDIELDQPIRIAPGEKVGIYIHSRRPGDTALVYDNARGYENQDEVVRIHTGLAHLSNIPFNSSHVFGTAWRIRREFVGRITYGIKKLLWAPITHHYFPTSFRLGVRTMLLCQMKLLLNHQKEKASITLGDLPTMVIYQIFNYLNWDSFPESNYYFSLPAMPRRMFQFHSSSIDNATTNNTTSATNKNQTSTLTNMFNFLWSTKD